jgi:hypothetical protein
MTFDGPPKPPLANCLTAVPHLKAMAARFDTMTHRTDKMIRRRQWQILALITMSLVGVAFGIWLFRAGFTILGCAYIGVFLWRGQQFAV